MKKIKLDKKAIGKLQQIYDEAHGIMMLLTDLSLRRNYLERQAQEIMEKTTKQKCTVFFDKKGIITSINLNDNEKT